MQFSCIKLRPHEKNAAFRPRGCMKIQSGLLLLRPYKKPQPLRRVFSAGTAAFSLALHKVAPRKNALFQQKILRRMAVSRDSPQTKSAGNPQLVKKVLLDFFDKLPTKLQNQYL